jgi:hypothetical protein
MKGGKEKTLDLPYSRLSSEKSAVAAVPMNPVFIGIFDQKTMSKWRDIGVTSR